MPILPKWKREMILGIGGPLIGAIATVLVAQIQARRDVAPPVPPKTLVSAGIEQPTSTSGAGPAARGEWVVQMKVDDWEWANAWINGECRPSDLTGIILVSLQKGNNSPYSFFVLCRKDNSPTARYALQMTPYSDDVLTSMKLVLDNPNAKLGPFYFSAWGHGGAFWYVEQTKQQ